MASLCSDCRALCSLSAATQAAAKVIVRRRRPGRLRIKREVEQLIIRMARENRDWGYDRIAGALANLGYEISDQTVGNVLRRHGLPPAPERKRATTWATFVRTLMASSEPGRTLAFPPFQGASGDVSFNLPAYGWLLSAHDRRVHNVRRFTGGQARALLAGHGFRVLRSSYWNTLLFPLMLLHRLVERRGAESDMRDYPRWLDALFSTALAIERTAIAAGLSLPFGGSLIVVAARDG